MAALATGDQRWLTFAESCAQTVLMSAPHSPYIGLATRVGLAVIAVLREDREHCRSSLGDLSPVRGNMLLYISGDRVLGLVASVAGAQKVASQHFEEAMTFCRAHGLGPELAWTCRDYARRLVRRAQRSDMARARQIIAEGRELAGGLGIEPLGHELLSLEQAATSVARKGAARPPLDLSPRELRVLELIARGMSDKAIAERLSISPHTVSNHVRSILRKTGSRNRTEAAVGAAEPIPAK